MSERKSQVQSHRVLSGGERADPQAELAAAVRAGLCAQPKRLSSRWCYDDVGSELFARICDQPEYYPTRTELQILRRARAQLCASATRDGAPLNVVDLGAGDGRKTRLVLEALLEAGAPVRYVPIDISEGAMGELLARMATELPELEVLGLVAEYAAGLASLAAERPKGRNLVLFLGSSIGNFRPTEARALLTELRDACQPGDLLLVGFDLKKDPELLHRAYNDRAGVSAAFNLHLLQRLNRELGADFDAGSFLRYATYNAHSGAVESCLLSRQQQRVTLAALDLAVDFAPWEPIHLEYSYKFRVAEVEELGRALGLEPEAMLFDESAWFVDALWRVPRRDP